MRTLRPIKQYKTSYDLRDEQEDDGTVIKVPSLEEMVEELENIPNPDAVDERVKVRLRSELEEEQLREKTLFKVMPEERQRLKLEGYILRLKTSFYDTIPGRLRQIEEDGYDAETLIQMQRLDPDFLNPLLTAIQKRPTRRAKAERAIERILLQRRAGGQPQGGR